ncbi:MAG: BRO family protein [Candidatus Saccharibacteria bacterium]
MEPITIYKNERFGEIRTMVTDTGISLFCLNDVCHILDIGNVVMTKSTLNPEGIVTTTGVVNILKRADGTIFERMGELFFVTEANLYKVIFQSRMPEAKAFTDWVTREVLPSLHKSGGYIVSKEDETPEMLMERALLVAKEAIERQKQILKAKDEELERMKRQLDNQAPIIAYANEVLTSTSAHTTTSIGAQFNMSAVILNRLLVKAGFLRRTSTGYSLTAKYQGQNYSVVETFKYEGSDGGNRSALHIKYTEKGRLKIYDIIRRAIDVGLLKEVRGRYFINKDWKPQKAA